MIQMYLYLNVLLQYCNYELTNYQLMQHSNGKMVKPSFIIKMKCKYSVGQLFQIVFIKNASINST